MTTFPVLLLLLPLISLALEDYESYNVLSVRDSNLPELLTKYHELYLFMHNPSCPYSEQYRARFGSFAINLKQSGSAEILGLVNCPKEPEICHRYSVISFPTVLKVNSTGFELVNEMKFINGEEKVEDQPYLTSQIVEWLEQDPHYVVVILEEEGMPVTERLERDRLLYLQPSLLYFTLFNLSNQRTGCWIYKYDKNDTSALIKYSCGSGIDPTVIAAALHSFDEGKLEEYIYKTDHNYGGQLAHEQSLTYDNLKTFLNLTHKPNKLIFFTAQWCIFCKEAGQGVSEAIDILRQKKIADTIQKYSKYVIDYNEVPRDKAILKLPYLELWFKNVNHIFQGKFDGISISEFIEQVVAGSWKPLVKKQSVGVQKQDNDL